MVERILISDAHLYVGKAVGVDAWVYNKRSSGGIIFLQLRDGSGFIQAVVEKSSVSEEAWAISEKITLESSVSISGIVSKHPRRDEYELQVSEVKVYHIADEYPIGKKEHGPDFLLDHRHLWIRSRRQWAIMRIRNAVINATYEWMAKNRFVKFDSPILTPNACEGTTTLFEVEYFDLGKAYLSQSGQLYLEAAIASFGRVFDFGPVFRAEKSKTRRHLTEFWMMDAEAAFVRHEENLKLQEELISYIVMYVLERCGTEFAILERNTEPLKKITPPFYRMTHEEAVRKLKKMGSRITYDDDLGGEDETKVTSDLDKPLFIEKYPSKIKAFYMKRDPTNPELALCADLIATEGYGEIIGGSEREDDYETLMKRIREFGLPAGPFKWYLDLRRYGSVPHSGFGYGLERIVAWLSGVPHVREAIPFPRMINRVTP
jgi:asparaginyl-tRNA synthetase